jgi:hypothetical protein
MSFHQRLADLTESVKQDLTVGASVQSVVECHFSDIKALLRSQKNRSGPFTVRQLAEVLDIGYFALRTALKRAEQKSTLSEPVSMTTRFTAATFSEPINKFAKQHTTRTNNATAVLKVGQIGGEDREIIESGDAFLLDFEDGLDVYKMVLREERDGVRVFDAYARAGQSKLSKMIKFNTATGMFDKG